MNVSFLFSGVANPNALMALLGIFILVAGTNAGKLGLNCWVLSNIHRFMNKKTYDVGVKVSTEH